MTRRAGFENSGRLGNAAAIVARYVYALGRDFFEGQINLRAASLVYTSLLSLVPLLALAFSILKALGAQNTMRPLLLQFLAPLGVQGDTIADDVIGFVDRMQVGVLGSVGIVTLLYTTVSTMRQVEASFNFLWEVPRLRGLMQSAGKYLAMILIGPIMMFAALGITASVFGSDLALQLRDIQPFGWTLFAAAHVMPYLLTMVSFTLLYLTIPNTEVDWRAAAVGGCAAGIAWQASSIAFSRFVAGASHYNAVYSGFAILIFLLLWLYLSWMIVLSGCRLAFYVQYPRRMRRVAALIPPSARESEWMALRVMYTVGRRFVAGEPPLSAEALAGEASLPLERVMLALRALERGGLLAVAADSKVLLPARNPQTIALHELWSIARGEAHATSGDTAAAKIDAYLGELERRAAEGFGNPSLADWVHE